MIKYFATILAFLIIVWAPQITEAQPNINKDVCKNVPASGSTPSFCKDQVKNTKNIENNPIYGPNGIVSKVVNILSMVVAVAAVLFIILAAFRYVTSGNNAEEVNKAREYIIYALIALLLVAVAQLLVRYILKEIDLRYAN